MSSIVVFPGAVDDWSLRRMLRACPGRFWNGPDYPPREHCGALPVRIVKYLDF